MINIQHNLCTGCGLCVINCPSKCLKMKESEEGFVYPVITNRDRCINCDLCNQLCPTRLALKENSQKFYALQLKDNDKLKKCASGGAFTTLALKVISLGGIVCGVCQDGKEIKFDFISSKDEIVKVEGSKYYQCNLDSNIYKKMMDLDNNTLVLFSGTPCQIAAIENKFRKKFKDNLITVEIICQGVPSKKVIDRFYLEKEKNKNKSIKIHYFRSKDEFVGRDYLNKYVYEDGTIEYLKGSKDILTKSFQNQIFLRESCYLCNFTKNNRVADFTIGDLWNYNLKNKDIDFKNGVSVLVTNNDRAVSFINKCSKLSYFEEIFSDSVKNNIPFNHSVKRPFARNFSYKLLEKNMNFKSIVNVCCVKYNIKLLIKKLIKRS